MSETAAGGLVHRQLADNKTVGVVGFVVAAVFLVLALLTCGAIALMRRKNSQSRDLPEAPKVESDTSDDASEGASVASEFDIMESCIDVHKCTSASCHVCCKDQAPDFIQAPNMPPEFATKMLSANHRWWEKHESSTDQPETLHVIEETLPVDEGKIPRVEQGV